MPRSSKRVKQARAVLEISVSSEILAFPTPPPCEPQPRPSGIRRADTTDELQPKVETSLAFLKRKLREQQPLRVKRLKESYMIVSKEKHIQRYLTVCSKCKTDSLESPNLSVRFGAAHKIISEYQMCGEDDEHYTSHTIEPEEKLDVNMKLMEFDLANNGYRIIESMEEIFEAKLMSSNFHGIAKEIE